MINYRTTIGGAISTIGKGLIAMGVLTQLSGNHSEILWYITLVGYIINIIGEGLAKLFAADAKELKDLSQQVKEQNVVNQEQIESKQDK